tara:strand:+ start:96 stop:386 length:291 start_codon:yes stop_codon:yes gene_type:complete
MKNESEIHNHTRRWIEEVKADSLESFNEFRAQFENLEKEVFGSIPERSKNPVAMQYDGVRNALARHLGYKKGYDGYRPGNLESAIQLFSEIEKPES